MRQTAISTRQLISFALWVSPRPLSVPVARLMKAQSQRLSRLMVQREQFLSFPARPTSLAPTRSLPALRLSLPKLLLKMILPMLTLFSRQSLARARYRRLSPTRSTTSVRICAFCVLHALRLNPVPLPATFTLAASLPHW